MVGRCRTHLTTVPLEGPGSCDIILQPLPITTSTTRPYSWDNDSLVLPATVLARWVEALGSQRAMGVHRGRLYMHWVGELKGEWPGHPGVCYSARLEPTLISFQMDNQWTQQDLYYPPTSLLILLNQISGVQYSGCICLSCVAITLFKWSQLYKSWYLVGEILPHTLTCCSCLKLFWLFLAFILHLHFRIILSSSLKSPIQNLIGILLTL